MNLLEKTIAILSPHTCLGCGAYGTSLCRDCSYSLWYPEQCYKCKKPSAGGITHKKCRGRWGPDAVLSTSAHEGLAKELVRHMKYGPSRDSAGCAGVLMTPLLPYLDKNTTIVTHIPTTRDRVRQRGFDQSQLMAKTVAGLLGLDYRQIIKRVGKQHQVGASKKERLEHMKDAFECKNVPESYKSVVLVDDVLTTGATLESASKCVRQAGAETVIGLIFARA